MGIQTYGPNGKFSLSFLLKNSLNEKNAVFGSDMNKVTIFGKGGKEFQFETKTKQDIARDIVDTIIQLFYE